MDVPQLFSTATNGAVGMVFGAAIPGADALSHPFTVCVTVNVPPLNTVMDGDDEPVLHNSVPV